MKKYKLLQELTTPTITINKGVVKSENEWIEIIHNLQPGECEIKTDWFELIDNELKTLDEIINYFNCINFHIINNFQNITHVINVNCAELKYIRSLIITMTYNNNHFDFIELNIHNDIVLNIYGRKVIITNRPLY